jgi:deferrochelatase/peroxidase EfeB
LCLTAYSFGYKDGISQPGIKDLPGLTKEEAFVPPGQDTIDQGVILCGRPGDSKATSRPPWMVDGSFLAFRKLKQNVQDWDKFLVDSSNVLGTFPAQLGARLIGRWKSGCPVNLQADFDDTNIGNDVSLSP